MHVSFSKNQLGRKLGSKTGSIFWLTESTPSQLSKKPLNCQFTTLAPDVGRHAGLLGELHGLRQEVPDLGLRCLGPCCRCHGRRRCWWCSCLVLRCGNGGGILSGVCAVGVVGAIPGHGWRKGAFSIFFCR